MLLSLWNAGYFYFLLNCKGNITYCSSHTCTTCEECLKFIISLRITDLVASKNLSALIVPNKLFFFFFFSKPALFNFRHLMRKIWTKCLNIEKLKHYCFLSQHMSLCSQRKQHKIKDLSCRFMLVRAPLPVWKATHCHQWNTLPPPLPLVMPNCVLQHLFIIDGQHDGYGHNINVRLTQQRHESWPTLFQSRRFIGPPLKSDI